MGRIKPLRLALIVVIAAAGLTGCRSAERTSDSGAQLPPDERVRRDQLAEMSSKDAQDVKSQRARTPDRRDRLYRRDTGQRVIDQPRPRP